MEKQQEDAYKEAIEDYRAASRARMTKNSEINSTNILGVIPRRQISNYFVQFRKVLQPLFITFSICSIYLLQTI
jgi:SWI/SNF-related matrix-associated actin-dependent regulator 1 of chromatin subfamily A